MADVIHDLITEVLERFEWGERDALRPQRVLRTMNALYHSLNRECKCVQKTYVLDADNRTADEDYWVLPGDFLELFAKEGTVRDNYIYQKQPAFDYSSQYNFTIENLGAEKRIIIPSAPSDFTLTLHYCSLGLALVSKDDGDLAATETNTPEWESDDLYEALVCGTAIKLGKHDQYDADVVEFSRLKGVLTNLKWNRQSADDEGGGSYELLARL